ncbi:acetyltransferase (GNAT) family protein [Archangium gephyra]|uniref:Acetyltransferase n=1 Tax=Archangium gephyra TaxID=48 RepID=A0AAC8Q623_9BACT|nr:GNAT family N-acetyltransferase [Archangium gephyra]AKJ01206.1 Acetyltransferase [Archangium gephyra]REG24479.1 acetyltransferase (GNAT) family protein [Archangium gephyra]
MALELRRLLQEDDRSEFRSGNVDLDRFFQRYAGQNQFRHHIGTTYVAVEDGTIAGFVTVTPSEIVAAELPVPRRRKLPPYPLPVLRLARLAVDERARGRGIGSTLLRAVFVLAHRLADEFGCLGVVVDAKPEAVPFYEKLGFIDLGARAGQLGDRPEPRPMFLELGAIPKPSAS